MPCRVQGRAQDRAVSDVVCEDKDKPGIKCVAVFFAQAVMRREQFVVEPVRVGDVGVQIEVHAQAPCPVDMRMAAAISAGSALGQRAATC